MVIMSILEMNDYIISFRNKTDNQIVRIWNKSKYQCNDVIADIFFTWSNGKAKGHDAIIITGNKCDISCEYFIF